MTRATPNDVEEIIEFDTLSGSDLMPFIADANTIVDDRMGSLADNALKKLIEKWLAAHLAAMKEKRISEQAVGDQEYVYEGAADGMGLASTRYGQQVLDMDPTGAIDANPHYVTATHGEETFEEFDEDKSPNFK